MSEEVQSAITLLKAAIMVDAVSTKTSRENVDNKITALIAVVEREALERAAIFVRKQCIICEGTGYAPGMRECENCGRPIKAIRALIESKEG